ARPVKAAACTTAVIGLPCSSRSASSRSTWSRSARSQAGSVSRVPSSASSAASSAAPGTSAPRRPGGTRGSAPLRARQRGVWGPDGAVAAGDEAGPGGLPPAAAPAGGPGRADQTAGQQPVRAYRQLVLARVPGRSGQGRAQPVAGAFVQFTWQVDEAAPAGG